MALISTLGNAAAAHNNWPSVREALAITKPDRLNSWVGEGFVALSISPSQHSGKRHRKQDRNRNGSDNIFKK